MFRYLRSSEVAEHCFCSRASSSSSLHFIRSPVPSSIHPIHPPLFVPTFLYSCLIFLLSSHSSHPYGPFLFLFVTFILILPVFPILTFLSFDFLTPLRRIHPQHSSRPSLSQFIVFESDPDTSSYPKRHRPLTSPVELVSPGLVVPSCRPFVFICGALPSFHVSSCCGNIGE